MKTNINSNVLKTGAFALALGAGISGVASAQPAPQVYLNGTPLRLEQAPIQQNGRTLVPMRDIFEALGATVDYNSLNQSIAAVKGSTTVRMALGTTNATVNNLPVTLDAPAQSYYGKTMVPLRFVSEAMGADVSFNPALRIVSINSMGSSNAGNGNNPGNGYGNNNGNGGYNNNNGNGGYNNANGNNNNGGSQVGSYREISIPALAVVPVTIDQDLSSATATVNQRITATVISARAGDSEFPAGTVLQGNVVEATKHNGNNPGVLDIRFRSARLPDGTRIPLAGDLVSLDAASTVNQDGRIVATGEAKSTKNTLKIVGIGAGAGFLVGRLLKKDGALPAIIGAAGGFLFDRKKNKNNAADATLTAGTKIGVRLRTGVTYRDTTNYYDQRSAFVKL